MSFVMDVVRSCVNMRNLGGSSDTVPRNSACTTGTLNVVGLRTLSSSVYASRWDDDCWECLVRNEITSMALYHIWKILYQQEFANIEKSKRCELVGISVPNFLQQTSKHVDDRCSFKPTRLISLQTPI